MGLHIYPVEVVVTARTSRPERIETLSYKKPSCR